MRAELRKESVAVSALRCELFSVFAGGVVLLCARHELPADDMLLMQSL